MDNYFPFILLAHLQIPRFHISIIGVEGYYVLILCIAISLGSVCIMKKIIFTVILLSSALLMSACSNTAENNNSSDTGSAQNYSSVSSDTQSEGYESSLTENSNNQSNPNSSNESSMDVLNSESSNENSYESSDQSSSENIQTTTSSITFPININTWGITSKYSTKEEEYFNVPIRITSIICGDQAAKSVKEFLDESSSYNYTEPDKNAEWVIAEYEISLDGFPVDKGGTDSSVVSFIMGSDGNYIDYGDKKWSTTTINITDEQYYYEGIVTGKIAYQMISDYKDYVIIFGEYNETQAFFTPNTPSEASTLLNS